jgi:hypothetical protein
MRARSVVLCAFALAATPLLPACSSEPGTSNLIEPKDGAAPEGASGDQDAGGASDSSSGGPSQGDSAPPVTDDDAGPAQKDSGTADAPHPRDSGECVRPPYQTTNECSGIGTPNGPALPSCSKFDGNGQLLCPTIPGCTVVPDPSGSYCMGDGVHCALSDCGHICALPNWEPCYDVSTGECLEGC